MFGVKKPAGRVWPARSAAAVVLVFATSAVPSPAAPHQVGVAAAPGARQAGRIVFAGTGHRSLGLATSTESSTSLFGSGPAHFDRQPSARGGTLVFTSLRDDTRPQVYVRDTGQTVRQLTTGRDAAHPRITPDRRSVVFDSAEPGGPSGGTQRDLWRVGMDGSGLTRLTNTPTDEVSPTVSPDGTRIAFSSNAGLTRRWRIQARPLSGGQPTPVTVAAAGDATEPVWNPVNDTAHRDLIAYTLDPVEASPPRLRTASRTGRGTPRAAATTNATPVDPRLRVTDGKGNDQPLLAGVQANWRTRSADWAPDGDRVLFLSPDTTCGCPTTYDNVYLSGAHSTSPPDLVLGEDRAVDSPTWLGDGGGPNVVVARTTAAGPHTATLQDVRADGADPRDLGLPILKEDPAADTTTDPSADPLFNPSPGFDPWTERQSYTPDGRQIVVSRFADSGPNRTERIWLTDTDGSHAHPMTLDGRGPNDWDTDPAFSPDGRRLAFTRTSPGGVGGTAGDSRVLIADATTGAITATVQPPAGQRSANDAQPTWSPDGGTLAFTRSAVIEGGGGNKHIWTAPVNALGQQRDLSATSCPGNCQVIDDSPAFAPDGNAIAFNRKDGGGRVNERNGVLAMSPTGAACQVVLPTGQGPGACTRPLPDTSATGPFQPRDVAWSADGGRLLLTARRAVAANSPEALFSFDLASGQLSSLDAGLPGRQKEPSFQPSVDLAVSAPGSTPTVRIGDSSPVTVTVTNRGQSPSPGTTLTVATPSGVRLDGLTPSGGRCDTTVLRCDLGVLAPQASVRITAVLTGVTRGDQRVGWSVAGDVIDLSPSDDAAQTVVPVATAPPPVPPPNHPPGNPPDGPAVTVTAQPSPGFVGGRVVVSYTVLSARRAFATGLRLRLGLPAGMATEPLPAGCGSVACTVGDLPPGASSVIRVTLKPSQALNTTITATLTTTGSDSDPGDNVSRAPLRILRPHIVAVPPIGKPGFVTSVRGVDFPPGTPVRFTWSPGITAAAAPTLPGANRRFAGQLLILPKDQTGPRTITASGPGFSPASTPFLVVSGSIGPPNEVARR